MVKLSLILERFSAVEREVRLLRDSLRSQFYVASLNSLLRLNTSELRVLVALNMLGESNAVDVAKFLNIQRAMASKHLNVLCKMGLASKVRKHKVCYFAPLFKMTEKKGKV
jgi:DNA-binding MarR family transcriptional regulator